MSTSASEFPTSAPEEPASVWMATVSRFRPGDILLTFNARSHDRRDLKTSRVIRRATGGTFTHALICVTPTTFAEAIGDGVSLLSMNRSFAHSISNICVLRYHNEELARKAARRAQLQVGREYSFGRATQAVNPGPVWRRLQGGEGTFCSAMVANVYQEAGAPEFSATPIERTTPATLERMKGLTDVTESIFQEVLPPRNIGTMSALDGNHGQSPSMKQTELSRAFAKEMHPAAATFAADWPELGLEATAALNNLVHFVVEAFDALSRLPDARRLACFLELEHLDHRMAALIGSGEMDAFIAGMIELDVQMLDATLHEASNDSPDIDEAALRHTLEATMAQLQERRLALSSATEWNFDRSRAMTALLAFDRRLADATEARCNAYRQILARLEANR